MQKIISYPISVIYYILFGFWLLLFHPIQWLCYTFFGYEAHRKSVAILNWFLVRNTHLLGTKYTILNKKNIPQKKPIVFIANHQSLYDIPPFLWFMREWHPKFISKKELGKGIPSVSFNLKYGGSALIDRKDPKQALPEIKKIAELISKNNYSVVIFPEGTRSKTGQPKPFAVNGLKLLYETIPNGFFVPVTINNSWKMNRFGAFPMGLGNHLIFEIHPAIAIENSTFETVLTQTEQVIKNAIQS
jgi:1-acyl-sn-glycerol-3-phosphate acyltransferase